MKIEYVIGDATDPQGDGKKLIVHVCNNVGAWGAGFVMALSKKWKAPEKVYRAQKEYILGTVRMVEVEKDVFVCNLICEVRTLDSFARCEIIFSTSEGLSFDKEERYA